MDHPLGLGSAESPSDEALLARFSAQGDREALNALFQRHAALVGGLCLRMLPRHLAEEAAQESFLAVLEHAHSFRGDAPFKHWLTTLTPRHRIWAACPTRRAAAGQGAALGNAIFP